MQGDFIIPQRLKPGDHVAIVAPSSGAAAMFPWVYEQGLARMREIFGLVPVEFPTALKDGKFLAENPQARAKDINDAFSDPDIKAVVATIGGNDQIKILPYLDTKIIASNPKIFLGLSDNTNLHLILWNLGIVSYYGGSLMQQWANPGKMDEYTVEYFKKALFEEKIGEIRPSQQWNDVDFEWSDQELQKKQKPMEQNLGWVWRNATDKKITGRLWGGCWESIVWHMWAEKYLPSAKNLEGTIFYLETSEEIPTPENIYRSLVGMGIRGWLANFAAVLVGRPKTQHRGYIPSQGRGKYVTDLQEAIFKATSEYAPNVPVVFGIDFGHTDPQLLVPNGGMAEIDYQQKKISFL